MSYKDRQMAALVYTTSYLICMQPAIRHLIKIARFLHFLRGITGDIFINEYVIFPFKNDFNSWSDRGFHQQGFARCNSQLNNFCSSLGWMVPARVVGPNPHPLAWAAMQASAEQVRKPYQVRCNPFCNPTIFKHRDEKLDWKSNLKIIWSYKSLPCSFLMQEIL